MGFDFEALTRRICMLREEHGWGGAELARKCGLSPSCVNKLENNRNSNVLFGTLIRISDALGVELKELLFPPTVAENAEAEEKEKQAEKAIAFTDWACSEICTGADSALAFLVGARTMLEKLGLVERTYRRK